MRRFPLDVIDTIVSDRNVRFFTITDQFFAVTKHLIDPYSENPLEEPRPSVNWQLIMINDMVMNKLNPENKQTVIAHELAHVYLEHHNTPTNEKTKKKKDEEQEADNLIRSWGFNPKIDRSNLRPES
jgi:predicted metal-dependent peptidase